MKLLTILDITKKLAKRSDLIGEMEKSADTLQKWKEGAIPSELKMVSRHGQLIVMVQKRIDKILVDLLGEIPEVGKLVRQKFEYVLNQAKLVDRLDRTDPDMAFFEYARLEGLARELVDTLRRIAQNVIENLSSENPAETEQKATSQAINIQNANVILGNIHQPGNLQIGDHPQIQEIKGNKEHNKGSIKRILEIVITIFQFLKTILWSK